MHPLYANQMFPDIPGIQVDEGVPLGRRQQEQYTVSPLAGGLCEDNLPSSPLVFVSGTQLSKPGRDSMALDNLERYLHAQENANCVSAMTGSPYIFNASGPYGNTTIGDVQSPLPLVLRDISTVRRIGSPNSLYDDQSATEHCTSSVGSVWSPGATLSDDEMPCGLPSQSAEYDFASGRRESAQSALLSVQYSPLLLSSGAGNPSGSAGRSNSFVDPRQVQHSPDESEEVFQHNDDGFAYHGYGEMTTFAMPDVQYQQQHQQIMPAPFHLQGGGISDPKLSMRPQQQNFHADQGLRASLAESSSNTSVHSQIGDEFPVFPPTGPRETARSAKSATTTAKPMKSGSGLGRKPSIEQRAVVDTFNRVQQPSKVTKSSSGASKAKNLFCDDRHPLKQFKNASEYKKHMQTKHDRPFRCIFSPYSCTARFGSKNEWKRHVTSQHLYLDFWRCDQGPCAADPKCPKDFNRKDLFTQHLRRMHCTVPHGASRHDAPGANKKKEKPSPQMQYWESTLDPVRDRCHITRRHPPALSGCPLCPEKLFGGPNAWEERMEHVGKHFEKGEAGNASEGVDQLLEKWLVKEGLVVWEADEQTRGGRWVVPQGTSEAGGPRVVAAGELDAEGEVEE